MAVRRALVLGCGGTVGGAWTVGALAALAEHLQWDPRDAAVIVGTSSGSSIAAMLGAGLSVDDLLAAQRDDASAREPIRQFFTRPPRRFPPLPRPGITSPSVAFRGLWRRSGVLLASGLAPVGGGTPSFLDPLADALAPEHGWVTHPATWLVAVDLASGERVPFGARGAPIVPLRHALRASWAIPGWYQPVRAHGRRYADGGILSPTSADLVQRLALDEVVIVAPMASPLGCAPKGFAQRVESIAMRRHMSRTLEREIKTLKSAGLPVLSVVPDEIDLAQMGPNFMDPRRRLAALDVALETVPAALRSSVSTNVVALSG